MYKRQVINSLRIEEVPFLPYMDRPADTKAGCKHRCTDAALRYFKSEVMEMCHREGLYPVSYTHLDVYKRQIYGYTAERCACGIRWPWPGEKS